MSDDTKDADAELAGLAESEVTGAKLFILPVSREQAENGNYEGNETRAELRGDIRGKVRDVNDISDLARNRTDPIVTPDDLKLTKEEIQSLESERLFRNESEVDAANRLFKESLLPVAAAVVHTALFGRNERTKLTAQQMILDRTMGRVQDNPPEPERDPFKELLASCVRDLDEIQGTVAVGSIELAVEANLAKGETEMSEGTEDA